jgi:hypothetical protein
MLAAALVNVSAGAAVAEGAGADGVIVAVARPNGVYGCSFWSQRQFVAMSTQLPAST